MPGLMVVSVIPAFRMSAMIAAAMTAITTVPPASGKPYATTGGEQSDDG